MPADLPPSVQERYDALREGRPMWTANLAKPDPKPTRVRQSLPSVKELGGACEVCGDRRHVERMHLLRGAFKEDDLDLIMLGCGDFGACRVHPRHTREDKAKAGAEIRAVMRPVSVQKIVARKSRAWLDAEYPEAA